MPTSIGKIARRLLGPHLFHLVGAWYLRAFGDIALIARIIFDDLPKNARVLDIGGGDGTPLNYLMSAHSDASVTMIDPAQAIGGAIQKRYLDHVSRMHGTSLAQYCELASAQIDVVLILDVMHHIPHEERHYFLDSLAKVVRKTSARVIVVKDIEPDGSLSARMNYLADRYISNDKSVTPIGANAMTHLLRDTFGSTVPIQRSRLYDEHPPHYALSVTLDNYT